MKDYTCECCSKRWSDKTHYVAHMNTKKNTGQERKKRTHKKPLVKWSCRLCIKDYSCKNNFKKHCMTNFATHAVYANQELGLDIYKEGYTADGIKISDLIAQSKSSRNSSIVMTMEGGLEMTECIDFGGDDFVNELNAYINVAY